MSELPRTVRIREVGPRDGFQNEPEVIPTDVKVALINALGRTGLRRIEITSFVRADVIPQLADAAEVLAAVELPDTVTRSVLIPNERGLDNALALRDRFDEINVFLSASESHNRANVNRGVDDSLAGLERVLARAREHGLRCEAVISVAFGCPYEGMVDPEAVFAIGRRLAAAGAEEIGFGDTTGMANPAQVRAFFERAFERLPDVEVTAHFHNTRGQGLANAYAALEAGVSSLESSFGELGGCPVPAGATGNIASEDLVSMLHEMGIETGIDLPALLDCARAAVTRSDGRWAATRSSPARSTGTAELVARSLMFDSVLIANRGEIARRVIRTLDRLGIESIAVFTEVDADAPFVREAARALPISSYLDVAAVIDACERSGATALHPGYGFLSENPALARACEAAGVVFVGPPAAAVELMGDKLRAKDVARDAGVPVVPVFSEAEARTSDAPYPLLVKAAAGGGGRGMRVARSSDELDEALGGARREARGAFGDDRVFIERFLGRARHLEVQLIADAHGDVVHLGERECSLQRRHQKVIEESPSPVVDAELRARLGSEAVALARAAGYAGAGTVEFIADFDDPAEHYFLEVNARLQVEHPVTELVTGLDLVELQLRVAAGQPLPIAQADVVLARPRDRGADHRRGPVPGFPADGRPGAHLRSSRARNRARR